MFFVKVVLLLFIVVTKQKKTHPYEKQGWEKLL